MDRRGTFRYTEPAIKKVRAAAEKADYNFPKMVAGLGLAAIAAAIKVFVPVVPFMEWLFITGITIALAGLGIKIDRMLKGGDAWKNEMQIINKFVNKGGFK
jgi:hypothetical protein